MTVNFISGKPRVVCNVDAKRSWCAKRPFKNAPNLLVRVVKSELCPVEKPYCVYLRNLPDPSQGKTSLSVNVSDQFMKMGNMNHRQSNQIGRRAVTVPKQGQRGH